MRRIQRGLWALDPDIEARVVGPYLTAPLPSYVSLFSALAEHGMIEQIPRQISLVSPDGAARGLIHEPGRPEGSACCRRSSQR